MPKVEKLQRQPLAKRAVQAIRDAIFAGEYQPGQRMVEEELATRLGVSRNVVREAFSQLEAQGLVYSDDYKGKSVAALSLEEMTELVPLRLIMESLAATWAAQRITPEGAAALRRQVAKFTKPQPESSNYAEIDFELHEMIWELAGNLRLAQTLDRIAGPMIALQARVYGPLLPDLVRKEAEAREGSHTRIVEAICAGNAAKARTAVQRHVLDFWRIWLKQSSADAAAIQESREAINEAIDLLEPLAAIFEPVAKKHRAM